MQNEITNPTNINGTNYNTKFHEQTRSKIGRIFVWGFFIGIFGSIVLAIIYNVCIFLLTQSTELFIDLNTIIPLLGSVVWTPLWFVMGYYFKTEKDDF